MKSGHAKNIANFETLTIILATCDGHSGRSSILLTALKTRLEEAKAILDEIEIAQTEKDARLGALQFELDDLEKYLGGLKQAAETALRDDELTRGLQAIVDLFNPKKRAAVVSGDNSPAAGVSDSRTALFVVRRRRDNQILRLAEMFALLRPRADYKPAETRYEISAIEARLIRLTAKNIAAKAAESALDALEKSRDRVLYDPETGILALVRLIKAELAGSPGKDSAAYRQINALRFRRY